MTDRPSGGPPLYDVVMRQRACRSFLPDPVPDAVVERILGAALTTLATLMPGRLHELLGLPQDVKPYAVVPIGRPARPLGPPKRRDVAEVTHHDGWDAQRK